VYNAWLSDFLRKSYADYAYLASLTSAIISLITSMLLSYISRWLSGLLTDLENHKTASQHQSKDFVLKFDYVKKLMAV
jgi:hypothetical protein